MLNILNVQREKQKEPIIENSKLSAYISDLVFGYSKQALDKVEIRCYDRKIYVYKTLLRRVIYCYHLDLRHPSGSIIEKKPIGMQLERTCHEIRAV